MVIHVRAETPGDAAAIHALNLAAFGSDAEARLVDALRANGGLSVSLVAILEGAVVGHIAFSPVTIASEAHVVRGVGLAPMAVAPTHQRRGIGGRLIEEGLRGLRAMGVPFCVVLGHAAYYPRHGFERASARGIRWEKPAPEDVFFVQEITPGGLRGVSGVARYRPELGDV